MLHDLQIALHTVAAKPAALRGFVGHTATLADSFANVKDEFAGMFKPAAGVLSAIAGQRVALTSTFELAPSTFGAVEWGLGHVDPALDNLDALARDAQRPLEQAPQALEQTTALLTTARRSVPPVDATLRLAQRAVSPTLRVLGSARTAAPWIDGLLTGAGPTVDELTPRRCDIVRLARNWQNMFAFGEPKQQGGTGLDLDIATPGLNAVGGLPVPAGADVPILRNPYPAPCASYYNGANLPGHGGSP
jgi:ABC-type transporter Mla subunit MlaD